MPFTFAHPAYAFPVKFISTRWFSLTGLVLGSMAPDFEYFLALEPYQKIGHSFAGFFIQGIPLSLLFAYLFHTFVRESLVLHLPSLLDINRRGYSLVSSWGLQTLRDWLVFILSVFIGFLSHIALDAFTHESGYMVRHLIILQSIVVWNLPVYKILQHTLSMIGIMYVVGVIGLALYKTVPHRKMLPAITYKQKLYFWSFALMGAVFITACKLIFTSSGNIIGILVVAPISGFCLGVLLISLFLNTKRHRTK
ncbi:DUF4184 family protein [Paenibacillus planticolens]|uniref:DUF4184 family protein n=1 Tax=Paenibacillus planticolens TaxID=2654976 RepID=A0ABX1ZF15_9BACL|nr:DUF4184 family protein [Paenibacillus planticolens]NOU98688.1 DUF4184 family protein [Paenibacillus planticolens]